MVFWLGMPTTANAKKRKSIFNAVSYYMCVISVIALMLLARCGVC